MSLAGIWYRIPIHNIGENGYNERIGEQTWQTIQKTKINDIHYMDDLITCGVQTACGRVMMSDPRELSSWFTQWGKTPVVNNKGFVNLTIDPKQVTCSECISVLDGSDRPNPFKVIAKKEFIIKKPTAI